MSNEILRKKTTGEPGNGGHFGSKTHDGADCELTATVEMTSEEAKTAVLAKVAAAPFIHDLYFVEYDDKFSEEQMGQYLAGDWMEIENEIQDIWSDSAYDNAEEAARGFCDEAGVEWDDMDEDDKDAVREAIRDRDTSDPCGELLRHTPSQLMRAPILDLSKAVYDWNQEHDYALDPRHASQDGTHDARVAILSKILTDKGMDVTGEEAQAAISGLASDGPDTWHEGVVLDVIWYGGLEDAAVPDSNGDNADAVRKLTFDTPHIVLLDKWSGQGWEYEVPGELSVTATKDAPVRLDSDKQGTGGYGWDDVAGVYKPAFAANPKSELLVPTTV